MHQSFLGIAILALTLPAAPARAMAETQIDATAAQDVLSYIEHKDCKGAVNALNKAIANKKPGILLMAGALFEQGLCVKPNWDTAANYYLRAHEEGNRSALPRLISGYAENNRDPAAAMWWVSKSPYSLPPACASANHLASDPEAFVAALQSWPKAQLAACVYAAGVLHRIVGDVEFPGNASRQGIAGNVYMHFVPATGTVRWTAGEMNRVPFTRVLQPGDDERSEFKDPLLKHVTAVGERSLKQFTRPPDIDPAWLIKVQFNFHLD
ncbi:MAG: hypothetical protein V4484_04780 [Pseudomonadota bacterium]